MNSLLKAEPDPDSLCGCCLPFLNYAAQAPTRVANFRDVNFEDTATVNMHTALCAQHVSKLSLHDVIHVQSLEADAHQLKAVQSISACQQPSMSDVVALFILLVLECEPPPPSAAANLLRQCLCAQTCWLLPGGTQSSGRYVATCHKFATSQNQE